MRGGKNIALIEVCICTPSLQEARVRDDVNLSDSDLHIPNIELGQGHVFIAADQAVVYGFFLYSKVKGKDIALRREQE